MKKIITFIVLFLFVFVLAGCNQKPNDVSQKVWDKGIQYTIYLNKTLKGNDETPDEFNDTILSFLSSGDKKFSKDEQEIMKNLRQLNINF